MFFFFVTRKKNNPHHYKLIWSVFPNFISKSEGEQINEQNPQPGKPWTNKTTFSVKYSFVSVVTWYNPGSAGKETKEAGWSAPRSGRIRNGRISSRSERTIRTEIKLHLHIQLCTAHCAWQEWLQFSQRHDSEVNILDY